MRKGRNRSKGSKSMQLRRQVKGETGYQVKGKDKRKSGREVQRVWERGSRGGIEYRSQGSVAWKE